MWNGGKGVVQSGEFCALVRLAMAAMARTAPVRMCSIERFGGLRAVRDGFTEIPSWTLGVCVGHGSQDWPVEYRTVLEDAPAGDSGRGVHCRAMFSRPRSKSCHDVEHPSDAAQRRVRGRSPINRTLESPSKRPRARR